MERLLVIKLDALDSEAEVRLNGIPLARVNAARTRATVPVHEYTMAGTNRLELVVWPHPAATAADPALPTLPCVADGKRAAVARILLPRIGSAIDETAARSLAQLEWAPAAGEKYDAPLTLTLDVVLPVSFPRWRWMEAPPAEATPALAAQALAFVQAMAQDLAGGVTERFMTATRLRTEELAIAYQRRPEDETQRLRDHLLALHAAARLPFLPVQAEGFVLRAVAGGRLFECLDVAGQPALSTAVDAQGRSLALPLRVAFVDDKLYVLR